MNPNNNSSFQTGEWILSERVELLAYTAARILILYLLGAIGAFLSFLWLDQAWEKYVIFAYLLISFPFLLYIRRTCLSAEKSFQGSVILVTYVSILPIMVLVLINDMIITYAFLGLPLILMASSLITLRAGRIYAFVYFLVGLAVGILDLLDFYEPSFTVNELSEEIVVISIYIFAVYLGIQIVHRSLGGMSKALGILSSEIAERIKLQAQLEELAAIDPLTGALNRRHFFDLASQSLAQAQENETPVSLLMIDIDNYKQFNDQFGHPFGDRVLVAFTERIHQHIRKQDSLGRYGGDEFVITLPETGAVEAEKAAGRILYSFVDSPLRIEREEVTLSLSVGIASSERSGSFVIEELLAQADNALYAAKERGSGQVVVWDDHLN